MCNQREAWGEVAHGGGQEVNTPSHSPPSLHSLIGLPLGQTQNSKVRETH